MVSSELPFLPFFPFVPSVHFLGHLHKAKLFCFADY